MNNYRLILAYDGTPYHGWQMQDNAITVQECLTRAAEKIFAQEISVNGCSRTDSGVHANEFCLTVECDGGTIPADKLPIAVARFLPEDLCQFYAEKCENDFHPRYDVKEKEYLYRIINRPIYDPFEYGRAWFLSRPISDEGLELMNKAARHFIGKFDFSTFMSEGSDVEDTVRNLTALSVEKNGDLIEIRISADGFLYNMVRIIVGTLTEVAFGRISPDDIPDIIASCDRSRAGMTAPAEGLFLNKVSY